MLKFTGYRNLFQLTLWGVLVFFLPEPPQEGPKFLLTRTLLGSNIAGLQIHLTSH